MNSLNENYRETQGTLSKEPDRRDEHRRVISHHLTHGREQANASGTLCILGAGAGISLNFSELARVFDQVDLVDYPKDPSPEIPSGATDTIHVLTGVDSIGLLSDRVSAREVQPETDLGIPSRLEKRAPYDVVMSLDQLNLLSEGLSLEPSPNSEQMRRVTAHQLRHLTLMIRLLNPESASFGFLTVRLPDLVRTAGEDPDDRDQLSGVLESLMEREELPRDLHPLRVRETLHRDPYVARRLGPRIQLIKPWFVSRQYQEGAGYGLKFLRNPHP